MNVVLNFRQSPESEFGIYGHAYHEAGRTLAEGLLSGFGIRDFEVLPLVFLFRHALELYLKAVLFWGNRLMNFNGDGVTEEELWKQFNGHRLTPLLDRVQKVLEFMNWEWQTENPGSETIADARAVIAELDAVDPNSFAFRYPTTKSGDGALEHHFLFNLREFLAVIDPLVDMLDTAVFGLEAEWDNACSAYDSYGYE
jgi:hypothetical protein